MEDMEVVHQITHQGLAPKKASLSIWSTREGMVGGFSGVGGMEEGSDLQTGW